MQAGYKVNLESVHIFGSGYVEKNQNNCIIIYDDEQYKLTNCFLDDIYERNKWYLDIQLKLFSPNNNCSNLFLGTHVESLSFSNFIFQNVTNMQSISSGCSSLISLPDISNWNYYMMFYNCWSLTTIAKFSNLKNSQIYNLIENGNLFEVCYELKKYSWEV